MDYPYVTVDVFTTRRFGGNPLAVIPDARGLSDAEMQQIAAEFSYSETAFVLPPSQPDATAQMRIFTPTSEVPFAGHPNVGTAFVLARQGTLFGQAVGDQLRFEERAGVVVVQVRREQGEVTGAAITAPQPLSVGDELPAALVAACASLDVDTITVDAHPPQIASVGLPFAIARLASREALARARPSPQHFAAADQAFSSKTAGFSLFLYVPLNPAGTLIAARMFAPLDNVLEDPATGSASAALGAYLVARSPAMDTDVAMVLHQGEDMGRPSRIELAVEKRAGAVTRAVVGGACVPVMRGTLTV